MQKASPTAASPETRLIPLNKLRHDDRNARAETDDPATAQADAELIASIRAHGLLENLVVTPRTKTLFGVAAGARRLRALAVLAAENHIPKNHPVPCLVVDNDAAADSSLAENAVRIAMHPADQVVAFSRLAREGATSEQIAARFGVAERTVQKRVRLGSLPAEIIDAYRAGKINADTAEAFATTADTGFQRTVFESLSQSGQLYGHNVRQALSQRQARSDSPAALYVGLDAYATAGGKIEDPVFEDDFLTLLDPDLMHELTQQKLNAEASKYAEAWQWTSTQLEFTWMDQQRHLLTAADVRAAFTDEETKALNEAEAAIEAAIEALGDPQFDGDRRRELWRTVTREQKRYADIERARADRGAYSDAVRAHSGVVVALDRDGNLDIHRGLVRAEDADAYRAATRPGNGATGDSAGNGVGAGNSLGSTAPVPGQPDDAATPGKKNGGYTDALRNDLRIMRTAAVRRALALNPAVATDFVGFVLARTVGFGNSAPRYQTPVLRIRQEYQGVYASDAMKASPIMSHLDPAPDVDLAWLADEDAGEAFRAYRALPDDTRASVLAHAVATLTVPHLGDDHDVSGALEETVRDLDIDFPAELAAVGAMPLDGELFWNRMNKALILGAAGETLGDEWVDRHGALKKKDLVAAAAQAFRHRRPPSPPTGRTTTPRPPTRSRPTASTGTSPRPPMATALPRRATASRPRTPTAPRSPRFSPPPEAAFRPRQGRLPRATPRPQVHTPSRAPRLSDGAVPPRTLRTSPLLHRPPWSALHTRRSSATIPPPPLPQPK